MRFIATLVVAVSTVSALAIRDDAPTAPSVCASGTETIVNATTIDGKILYQGVCKTADSLKARAVEEGLMKRQNRNLCGAPCTTYCNSGTGGPNPNDCSSLASSIANDGGVTLSAGESFYWSWGSCQAYIVNTSGSDEFECWDEGDFGGIVNYLAWNCQASTPGGPYLGGSCHFYDDTSIGWVQVQTV